MGILFIDLSVIFVGIGCVNSQSSREEYEIGKSLLENMEFGTQKETGTTSFFGGASNMKQGSKNYAENYPL